MELKLAWMLRGSLLLGLISCTSAPQDKEQTQIKDPVVNMDSVYVDDNVDAYSKEEEDSMFFFMDSVSMDEEQPEESDF